MALPSIAMAGIVDKNMFPVLKPGFFLGGYRIAGRENRPFHKLDARFGIDLAPRRPQYNSGLKIP